VMAARWPAADCAQIILRAYSAAGELLCENAYNRPFQPLGRPAGYPWKFDPYLGTKVFNRPDAPSLADQSGSALVRALPLPLRETFAEWMLRQSLPTRWVSRVARVVDAILG
ncbi:MAG: hypothetical protein K8I30_08755, partial [Anaerolineae bacterium]|nr:hypothetical protein [Anaerolineae bacterium]